jgi:hypothetical protein
MTQKERIHELLKSNGSEWTDMQELNRIAFRYSARLADLRADGIEIESRHEGSHWWYRLKAPPVIVAEPDGQLRMAI